ncbi:MAG: DUF4037 domain-containing protein [Verrucomicrobia bacterium]|nr:DUF4037 domain-containing protein [Verrucomicrobiota bacterium]
MSFRSKIEWIANNLQQHPAVEAVALAGSESEFRDAYSDYDLYVYAREWVNPEFRRSILGGDAKRLELHRTFWEDEDAWIDADGVKTEIMYRSCDWTENEIESRLDRHEASVGYTTAILFNIDRSQALFDRSGWLAQQKQRVSSPFPDGLQDAIITKNYPLLGDIISSYEEQIEVAVHRRDLVSINHRVAAWLSSFFDILFAHNRAFHPGEKRMLEHAEKLSSRPTSLRDAVSQVLSSCCQPTDATVTLLKNLRTDLAKLLSRPSAAL